MATTKYHDAARDGNVDLLRKMTRRDANKQDEDGLTCTCYAAYAGNLAALRVCIGRGGDPDICTFYGSTSLHLAAQGGNLNCVSLLANFGCNMWALDNDHRSALDVAAAHEHMDIVRYLDEQLAAQSKDNPSKVNKLKQRALIAADDRIKEFEKRQKRASAQLGRHLKRQEKTKRTNEFSAFVSGNGNTSNNPVIKVRHRTQSNPPPTNTSDHQQHTLLARGRLPLPLPRPYALPTSSNVVAGKTNGYAAALHDQLQALRLRQTSVQSSSPSTTACENDYESIGCQDENEQLPTQMVKVHKTTTITTDSNQPRYQSSMQAYRDGFVSNKPILSGIRSRSNRQDVLYVSKFTATTETENLNNRLFSSKPARRNVFGCDAESGVSSSSTSYRTDSGFGSDDATSLFDRRGFGEIVFRPPVLDAAALATMTSTRNALHSVSANSGGQAQENAKKTGDLPVVEFGRNFLRMSTAKNKPYVPNVTEKTAANVAVAEPRQSRSLLPKSGTFRSQSSHNSSHLYELSWSAADIGDLDDFTDEVETEMRLFLHANGLGDYIAAFERERLDLDTVMQLEDSDMMQLGIPLGHRKKLMSAICARREDLAKTDTKFGSHIVV